MRDCHFHSCTAFIKQWQFLPLPSSPHQAHCPMHTEGEGSGLLTRTRVRSDNRLPPPSDPVPLRRRLLLPVAAGTTCAVLAIIAISVWVPLHNSHAASTARAPTDKNSTPVRLREQPISESSRKAHQWPLSMYGVPVPGVRMPPFALKVSYWQLYYARYRFVQKLKHAVADCLPHETVAC